MVELWSEPLKLRYSNSRCSLAYLFTIIFYAIVIIVPFYLGFSTYSFWKKHETIYLQPKITFDNNFILSLQTSQGNSLVWSSLPSYNRVIPPQSRRPVQFSKIQKDEDENDHIDYFKFAASMPLLPGEDIRKASMYLFFRTTVCISRSVDQSISRSVGRSISRSVNQLVNCSTYYLPI